MVSGQHERTCLCVLMASESDDNSNVREKKTSRVTVCVTAKKSSKKCVN